MVAVVPPLRGPTRHKPARRKRSGRSGPFDFAQGRRDDGEEGEEKAPASEGGRYIAQQGGVKPPLHGRGREEYNCGHGQQADCTDIAGDRVTFAD